MARTDDADCEVLVVYAFVQRLRQDGEVYRDFFDSELPARTAIEVGQTAFLSGGSLTSGPPESAVIETALSTCDQFDILHQRLSPAAATEPDERLILDITPRSRRYLSRPDSRAMATSSVPVVGEMLADLVT